MRHTKYVLATFTGAGLLATSAASAAVTTQAWYRGGEADAGAPHPHFTVAAPTAEDSSINNRDLGKLSGGEGPYYFTAPGTPAPVVGSTEALGFNPGATNHYGRFDAVTTATDNVGIEAWAQIVNGGQDRMVLSLGGSGSGFSIGYRAATDSWQGLIGGVEWFGSGTVAASQWTHLALVRDNGLSTFYVNGVAAGTTAAVPIAPGGFTLLGTGTGGEFFSGQIDEARIFTFAPGQFSTGDLLITAIPEPTSLAALAASAMAVSRRRRAR